MKVVAKSGLRNRAAISSGSNEADGERQVFLAPNRRCKLRRIAQTVRRILVAEPAKSYDEAQ